MSDDRASTVTFHGVPVGEDRPGDTMGMVGWLLIGTGFAFVAWAVFTPTTVMTSNYDAVVNIGLVQRQSMLALAGAVAILGGIMTICAGRIVRAITSSPRP